MKRRKRKNLPTPTPGSPHPYPSIKHNQSIDNSYHITERSEHIVLVAFGCHPSDWKRMFSGRVAVVISRKEVTRQTEIGHFDEIGDMIGQKRKNLIQPTLIESFQYPSPTLNSALSLIEYTYPSDKSTTLSLSLS